MKRAQYDDPNVKEPKLQLNIMSVVKGLDADFNNMLVTKEHYGT